MPYLNERMNQKDFAESSIARKGRAKGYLDSRYYTNLALRRWERVRTPFRSGAVFLEPYQNLCVAKEED